MENKILKKLDILQKKNSLNTWVNKDSELYSFLCQKDIYTIAYENLKKTKIFSLKKLKTFTLCENIYSEIIDNQKLNKFSEYIIDVLCKEMKDESFKFTKAKKINSRKLDNSFCFLELKNKIVQEVIRIMLQAIWDNPKMSTFKENSYGFRPGKEKHNALQYVDQKFKNIKWLIKGDIKEIYNTINHDILLNLLKKRIKEGRFLRLIRKYLNSGYLKFTISVNNIIETLQGNIVSFILSDIYFHELDNYVLDIIKIIEEKENNKNLKKKNTVLKNKILEYKEKKFLPIHIKYVRYAGDWIIGVDGNLKIAQEIKNNVQEFLKNILRLQLNMEKINIIHLKSQKAYFLGYFLSMDSCVKTIEINNLSKRKHYKKKTWTYCLKFKLPIKILIKKLYEKKFCTITGFPQSKKSWTVLEDHVIIYQYNVLLLKLLKYYSKADNQKSLKTIQYILHYSCAMTLAQKHKSTISKIFKKFGKTLRIFVSNENSTEMSLNLTKRKYVFFKYQDFTKTKKFLKT